MKKCRSTFNVAIDRFPIFIKNKIQRGNLLAIWMITLTSKHKVGE
ncbi:hypothetical protein CMALT430_160195 [Carnobacterium maltaromaticum]|nr:hypothetical protein CMALT430_160195 [Carnobacterium maltaromaticum]